MLLQYATDNQKLISLGDENNLGLYYIPNSWKKGQDSAIVLDTNSKKLYRTGYLNVPYIKNQITNDFNNWVSSQGKGTSSHWGSRFFKKGGIIKAVMGQKFDTIDKARTYTSDDLLSNQRYRNILNKDGSIDSSQLRLDSRATDLQATNNG